MPNNYWLGHAVAVAQVKTHTVGGVPANGQIYTATINNKTLSYTATGADTNITIAAALYALLIAYDVEEYTEAEYSYTAATAIITSTVTEAGADVTMTTAADGTGTFVTATVTAATGPEWWTDIDNWSLQAVPVNGDSVYLRGTSTNITRGLAQSAVTLALLDIDSTYTGKIGLPDFHAATGGGATYSEYRATHLAIGATAVNVGRGSGSGSSRMRINFGTVQTTIRAYGTGQPETAGGVALDFIGTHAANALYASRGSIGAAVKPGTVAAVAAANIGSQGSPVSDVQCVFGDGCTLTDLKMTGGTVECRNGFATGELSDGELTVSGTAGVSTSLVANSGLVNYDTTGTLASYKGGKGSKIDFGRVVAARTVTAAVLVADASWNDPGELVTVGGSGIRVRCKLEDLGTIDVGTDFYVARTAAV